MLKTHGFFLWRVKLTAAHHIHALLFIRLELLLLEEVTVGSGFFAINEYPGVGLRGDHGHGLRYFLRIGLQVPARLLDVASQFLQVVLREGDLRVV